MQLHVGQAKFIRPALTALQTEGDHSVEFGIGDQFDLAKLDLSNAILPAPALYGAIEHIARVVGEEAPPARICDEYRLKNLASWGDALIGCENILSTIRLATSPAARIFSNNLVEMYVDGPICVFETNYDAAESIAQDWISTFSLILTVDGFRLGCGDDWEPLVIETTAKDAQPLADALGLRKARIRSGQERNRVGFPTSDLVKKMPRNLASGATMPAAPLDEAGKLNAVFDSLCSTHALNLQAVARLFDLSTRSLQRHLSAKGLTFEALLDDWRFSRAIQCIQDENIRVSQVSELLGYSNPSNFIRAFHRWTGSSPSNYLEAVH